MFLLPVSLRPNRPLCPGNAACWGGALLKALPVKGEWLSLLKPTSEIEMTFSGPTPGGIEKPWLLPQK